MKLPKYNLCYNTRDLIKSLAENANDRNEMETVLFSLPAIVALPAILAFEIENFLSLRSKRSLHQRGAD